MQIWPKKALSLDRMPDYRPPSDTVSRDKARKHVTISDQEPRVYEHHDDAQSEEGDEYDEGEEDFYSSFLRLLTTEDGEPITDVLKGIQTALQQQGKVLYKLVNVLDKHRA